MKRYQQQREQENVWRRGPTIHQFRPACRVRAPSTAQNTVNQKTPKIIPRPPKSTSEQPHRPHRKTPMHDETNLHQPKA